MGYRSNKVHKNDKNAPRMGKKEFSKILISKELYNRTIEDKESITWNQFKQLWFAITDTIRLEVSENPLGIKLPFFLGELKAQYLPYKPKTEDHKSAEEIGEVVPFVNINTKGKVGSIIWERKDARRFNKVLDLYAFEEDREITDAVSKAIDKNPDKFRVTRTRVSNRKKETK